jgi:hypothetical protein
MLDMMCVGRRVGESDALVYLRRAFPFLRNGGGGGGGANTRRIACCLADLTMHLTFGVVRLCGPEKGETE